MIYKLEWFNENTGWKGKNCTESNCIIKSCVNNGQCISVFENSLNQTDYRCACPAGYFGDQCEFLDKNPCLLSPCKIGEDCVQSSVDLSSFSCVKSADFCERVKPCNNNSECIFFKEKNTFECKCLNGAQQCDLVLVPELNATTLGPLSANSNPKVLTADLTESIKTAQADTKLQPEIPKLGFNFDNVGQFIFNFKLSLSLDLIWKLILNFKFQALSYSPGWSSRPSCNCFYDNCCLLWNKSQVLINKINWIFSK